MKTFFLIVGLLLSITFVNARDEPATGPSGTVCESAGGSCKGLPDGVKIGYKNDCTKFIQCFLECGCDMECPAGLHFNSERQVCDWPTSAKCDPSYVGPPTGPSGIECESPGELCKNVTDGAFIANATDCTKYIVCLMGCEISTNCPSGTHFSTTLKRCTFPTEAGCDSNETFNPPGPSPPGPSPPGPSPPGPSPPGPSPPGPSPPGPSPPGPPPPGPSPPGPSPPGPSPPGPSPPGPSPPGPSPPGPSPPGPSPPGPSPPGPSPPGPSPPGPSPPGPCTPGPSSPGPCSPGPSSPGSCTPSPSSPGSCTPGPCTPGPSSPGSCAPGPSSPGSCTPGPCTPGACTPAPCTPGPCTPAPCTPGPCTPAPCTPGPCSPVPCSPAPCTPGPCTPGPLTPGPSTGPSGLNCDASGESCKNMTDGTFIASPNDCNKYIECLMGCEISRDCPNGTHFSAEHKQCLLPAQAGCDSSYENYQPSPPEPAPCPCATAPPPVKQTERPTSSSKAPSSTAKPSTRQPFKPTPKPTPLPNGGGQSSCSGKESGKLLPFIGDCNKYIACGGGTAYIMDCGPGFHFNAPLEICDYPEYAGCDSLYAKPDYNPACQSRGATCYGKENGKLLPYAGICEWFVACFDGCGYDMACGKGLHFNKYSEVCDRPEDAGCDSKLLFPNIPKTT
ncbi:mucin-2-like isoform X3 [Eupeodes corollae]|uniref:mucin-2-like isoform X3 n=1 Tax=Eupeodes corollae TaxID=290404 RepID=UPI002493CA2A|nr:mucin-2-like isoform X3 [Eupeodes corollae]